MGPACLALTLAAWLALPGRECVCAWFTKYVAPSAYQSALVYHDGTPVWQVTEHATLDALLAESERVPCASW